MSYGPNCSSCYFSPYRCPQQKGQTIDMSEYDAKVDVFDQLLNVAVKDRLNFINTNREKLVAAFLAETGLLPSECELVEQRFMDGPDTFLVQPIQKEPVKAVETKPVRVIETKEEMRELMGPGFESFFPETES